MAAQRTPVPAPAKAPTAAPVLDALIAADSAATLERVEVDPRTLTLDKNARADLKLTDGFKALITEHGVLVPLLCRRDPLGQVLVVDGQRRLLAALEADLPAVPIAMLPPVGDDEARLWDQLVTNDGREPLNAAETAAAYQQLTLFGRSPATIARRAGVKRDVVDRALTVAQSPAATKAAAAVPAAHMDELAALAEFEGDDAALDALQTTLTTAPAQFRHRLQELRDTRDRAAAIADATKALPPGTEVRTAPYWSDRTVADLARLLDAPGGQPLTPENHADCPGHAVHISPRLTGATNGPRFETYLTWLCTTWRTAGHVNRHATAASGATSGPQDEDEKAARRRVIANNKAAEAAQAVRRQFLRELLQRTKLPTDAVVYAARLTRPGEHPPYGDHAIVHELLDPTTTTSSTATAAAIATPHQATRWLVALAAARVEASMSKDFWREQRPDHALHLTTLASWGYTLADVEQGVVDAAAAKAGA